MAPGVKLRCLLCCDIFSWRLVLEVLLSFPNFLPTTAVTPLFHSLKESPTPTIYLSTHIGTAPGALHLCSGGAVLNTMEGPPLLEPTFQSE